MMTMRILTARGAALVVCASLFLFAAAHARADEDTRDVQQILRNTGYDPGPVDGIWGGQTSRALAAWAEQSGRAYEGALTPDLYRALVEANPGLATGRRHLEAAVATLPIDLFPLDTTLCRGRYPSGSSFTYYEVVDRNVYGRDRIGGFIEDMGRALSAHMGERSRGTSGYASGVADEDFRQYLDLLDDAAADSAFTRLHFTSGGGSNPAHWVSALLNNLAYLVNYADRQSLWREGQRDRLVAWGDRLFDVSHRVSGPGAGQRIPSVRWPDTVGIQLLSYVNWGLATGNIEALGDGIDDWFFLFDLLQSDGAMRSFLNGGRWQNAGGVENNDFYYDNALGFMVVAATSARAAGIDLFGQVNNGATLHDAVRWRYLYVTDWQALEGVSAEPVYDRYNGRVRYWQSSSFGGNWGWTEAYVSAFPDSELAGQLIAENRARNGYGLYSSATLGPSSCLYGAHR